MSNWLAQFSTKTIHGGKQLIFLRMIHYLFQQNNMSMSRISSGGRNHDSCPLEAKEGVMLPGNLTVITRLQEVTALG